MNWRIGELLVRKKLISWEQLEEALDEQQRTHELIGEILVKKKFISAFLLYKTLAEKHRMQFIELQKIHVNPIAVEIVPKSVAMKFGFFPLELADNTLIITLSNPLNVLPEDELKKLIKIQSIRATLCMPQDLEWAWSYYYGVKPVSTVPVDRTGI